MKWISLLAPSVAALGLSGAAHAAVFTASSGFDMGQATYDFAYLPQYAGPLAIKQVQVTVTGETSAYQELINGGDPEYVPPEDLNWSAWAVALTAPDGYSQLIGSQDIQTQLPGVIADTGVSDRSTPTILVSFTGLDPNLSAYAGGGDVMFVLGAGPPYSATTQFSGTLTEQITLVPEPAAWALMLGGFFSVGATIRIGRRNLVVAAA